MTYSWRRLIAVAFLCSVAGAYAMVVPLSIEQLSRDADAIVVGKVVSVTPERRGALIYSMAAIKVEQVVKGDTGPEVTIESLGGRIGDETLAVSGTATYADGERVLVFLKKAGKADAYQTVGVHQGKLSIEHGMVVKYNLSLEALLRRVRSALVEPRK